ncbi:chymotrypsin-1-like [Cataglyphis hispanica]|uniref:chymotrypsin-1-like n=1 Tax=Cataglyphis hispanica TaxID=1086592 RepID=UPI00217F87F9|nr:chymotrypsin-1-like [Cataglyphis hispanica]
MMRQLTCILIALTIVGVYADEPERLVNGIPTTIKEYPHIVSLRINGNHMCGGNLISPRHVLTAAHCVEPLVKDDKLRNTFTVVSGTSLLSSGGQINKVSRMWYHEDFNKNGNMDSDIGLLELSSPITVNEVQKPISLPESDVQKNEAVTLVAWGSTGFMRPVHDDLRKLNAKIMLADECQKYHRLMRINDKEFCTLISRGTGACNGDSGSGVISDSNETLAGVVSRGIPCARGFPDTFTKVKSFLSWINNKMSS